MHSACQFIQRRKTQGFTGIRWPNGDMLSDTLSALRQRSQYGIYHRLGTGKQIRQPPHAIVHVLAIAMSAATAEAKTVPF